MAQISENPFEIFQLREDDSEYIEIKKTVESSKSLKLEVTNVFRIENMVLKEKYEQAKAHKLKTYNQLQEKLLFHGTNCNNQISICTNNLDTSLDTEYGNNVVRLTESSCYAARKPVPSEIGVERCMVACSVLMANPFEGKHINTESSNYDAKYGRFGYFRYGVVAKWQTEDIYPKYWINYKIVKK